MTDESNRPPFKRRNTNPFTEGYDPSLVETGQPGGALTTADGATVVPAYQSVEPSRAWENMGGAGAADGPRIPSGGASAFLAPQRRQRRGSDSDADSEATEGCDDVEDIDEGLLSSLSESIDCSTQLSCCHAVTLHLHLHTLVVVRQTAA